MNVAIVDGEWVNARNAEHGEEGKCVYCGKPVQAINRADEEKTWTRGQRGVGWMHQEQKDWLNCPHRDHIRDMREYEHETLAQVRSEAA